MTSQADVQNAMRILSAALPKKSRLVIEGGTDLVELNDGVPVVMRTQDVAAKLFPPFVIEGNPALGSAPAYLVKQHSGGWYLFAFDPDPIPNWELVRAVMSSAEFAILKGMAITSDKAETYFRAIANAQD
jgi:hypothetical protein